MQYFHIDERMKARWIVCGLFIISAAVLQQLPSTHAVQLYNMLQISAARLSLVFHTLAFAIAWNVFGERLKHGTMLLALALFGAAALDFLYLGASLGLPSLLPLHDVADAAPFWLAARLLTAAGILSAVLVSPVSVISRRHAAMLLGAMLIALATYVYAVFIFPPASGATGGFHDIVILKKSAQYLTAVLLLAALALLYRKLGAAVIPADAPGDKNADDVTDTGLYRIDIFSGVLLLFAAQIFFMLSPKAGSAAALAGSAYQLTAALLLYRGIAASSIKLPYRMLSQLAARLQATTEALHANQARLAGVIDTATDAIITVNESQSVVMANPAAVAMFRTTLKALQGSPIDRYIPLRHRHGYQGYVKNLGKVRSSFMKMSRTRSGHDVTGVRANGEEFPIEASISSMIENGRLFYTLILRDITERKQAQEALAKSHEELTRLSNALQRVREEERRTIARDLHDNLGQLLATLRNDLSLLQQKAADSLPRENLSGMDQLLASSITSLRRIATNLRPRALDEGGLYFALQNLARELSARHQAVCDLVASEDELALDDQRSTLIFRVVQEALSMLFREGSSRKVTIECERSEGLIEISLRDEGLHIRIDEMNSEMSIGILTMRENLRTMKGEIAISSDEKQGTRIDIALPAEAQETNL